MFAPLNKSAKLVQKVYNFTSAFSRRHWLHLIQSCCWPSHWPKITPSLQSQSSRRIVPAHEQRKTGQPSFCCTPALVHPAPGPSHAKFAPNQLLCRSGEHCYHLHIKQKHCPNYTWINANTLRGALQCHALRGHQQGRFWGAVAEVSLVKGKSIVILNTLLDISFAYRSMCGGWAHVDDASLRHLEVGHSQLSQLNCWSHIDVH